MRPSTVLILLTLLALDAGAETITVNRTDDPAPRPCINDACRIEGCEPVACSLREAMLTATVNGAADNTIVLPAGDYTLTRGVLPAMNGQDLHIQGAGSAQTLIALDAGHSGGIMLKTGLNSQLRLTGISLKAGGNPEWALMISNSAFSADDIVIDAGSVLISDSTATLRNAVVRRMFRNTGTTLIEDSALHRVHQPRVDFPAVPVQLTLRRTLVDDAIFPDAPFSSNFELRGGTMTIEDSTITRSSMLVDKMLLTLRRVHYVDNAGPVSSYGGTTIVIEDSLFENNTNLALFGQLALNGDGSHWTIRGSTFRNNRSSRSVVGAVYMADGTTLDIRNSTFAGNSFSLDAPAGARGAAIGFNGNAQVALRHVTIVPPAVMPIGTTGSAIGGTGTTATVGIYNSIVRGTCALEAGVLQGVSRGNIESPGNTCGLSAATNQVSVTNAALALGTLADHGGPTPTYSLNPGSVAIDNANTLYYLHTDQRGYLRSGANTSDIGAFEHDGIDRIFKNGFDG